MKITYSVRIKRVYNPFFEKFERSVRVSETYAGVQLCTKTMDFVINYHLHTRHLHHIIDPAHSYLGEKLQFCSKI